LAPRASDGSLRRLFEIVEQDLAPLAPQAARAMIDKLRGAASEDLLDPDTWRGLWLLMSYSMAQPTGWIKRRVSGDYETDEWGFDPEVAQAIRPLLELLYRNYWRVEVTGLEAIPDEGRSLLVSNHSGQLPWDGAMIGTAIHLDHPAHRLVRSLYDTWFPSLPVFSTLLTKLGQTLASVENGTRLLEEDELVAVFPEGTKGVGKLYRERYRLQRFGRGGFVRMALRTRAPMVPVAVVGAEETYVSLYKSETIARLIGFLPNLAHLALAGTARLRPDAHEVVHRLWRPHPHRELRRRGRRRSGNRFSPRRPDPEPRSGDALRTPCCTPFGVHGVTGRRQSDASASLSPVRGQR
jgi:1-acyl-sn-glycerol-3-phosphate acyltransferase